MSRLFTSCFSFSRTVVRRGNLLTFLESGASTTTTIQSLATPVFLILPCQAKISSLSPYVLACHFILLYITLLIRTKHDWFCCALHLVPVCTCPGQSHQSRMCETQAGPPTFCVINISSVQLYIILLLATCSHDAPVVRHQMEQRCTLCTSVCLVVHSSWHDIWHEYISNP